MSASQQAPSSPSDEPAPKRRWQDQASALLMLVALGAVVTVLVPSVLRSRAPVPAAVTARATASAAAPGTTWASDSPPRFDFSPRRLTEIERAYPDGMWPGQPSEDRPSAPAASPTKVRAAAPLALREMPDAKAAERARVAAGEPLLMMREREGWAFVVYRFDGGVESGWAPRRELMMP